MIIKNEIRKTGKSRKKLGLKLCKIDTSVFKDENYCFLLGKISKILILISNFGILMYFHIISNHFKRFCQFGFWRIM
jgi:hypothetical protein